MEFKPVAWRTGIRLEKALWSNVNEHQIGSDNRISSQNVVGGLSAKGLRMGLGKRSWHMCLEVHLSALLKWLGKSHSEDGSGEP